MNSFNHYAYGAVGAWMYATVAGLDIDHTQPGYKHILLKPHPGGDLTYARAKLDSVYGPVESSWRLEDEKLFWKIVVPANTTATAWLPGAAGKRVREGGREVAQADGVQWLKNEDGASVYALSSGVYHFEVTR
jgi:alpha-L-rhamnosidase